MIHSGVLLGEYIFVANLQMGSGVMRGQQIADQLASLGVQVRLISLTDLQVDNFSTRRCTFIFIKETCSSQTAKRLRAAGHRIIWDMVDVWCVDSWKYANRWRRSRRFRSHVQAVLMPNDNAVNAWSKYFPHSCSKEMLLHHWDPRIQKQQANEFRLLYFGEPLNLPRHFRQLPHLEEIPFLNQQNTDHIGLFEQARSFNCHLVVWPWYQFRRRWYKPNTKLSTAAAFGANAVVTPDLPYRVLLDSDYPYFAKSPKFNDIAASIDLAATTYGNPIWKQGLDMMSQVRERTSLQRIGSDYIAFLERFNDLYPA